MRNAGRRAPPATGQRAAGLSCLEAALAEAGAALGTDRPDIQGQRVVELAAWEHGVALAHALLDGDIEAAPAPLAAWRADLDEQLAPLVDAVNAATRRPRRALWRGVEDRIAGAIVWIAQTTGREDRARELATLVIPGAEVRDTVHLRRSCCLYYRTPEGITCDGCPLRVHGGA